jgi:hypothetical protein
LGNIGGRYVKMLCKRVSLPIGALLGKLDFVCRQLLREKKKYIWVPFSDPEGIKILSLGAILNFIKATGLP